MFLTTVEWLTLGIISVVSAGAYTHLLLKLRSARKQPSLVLDRHNSSLFANLIFAALVANLIFPLGLAVLHIQYMSAVPPTRPAWTPLFVYIVIVTEGMHAFISIVAARSVKLKL